MATRALRSNGRRNNSLPCEPTCEKGRPNGHGLARAVRYAMMSQLARQKRSGPRRLQPGVRRRTPFAGTFARRFAPKVFGQFLPSSYPATTALSSAVVLPSATMDHTFQPDRHLKFAKLAARK
jgi:hypothetical protein